uniref:SprT-like domain-containing protein n=1 Tax=Timema douglasi TaxID=61478 RepID=A0A7R8VA78_TIMDO|nr:unnamed protein product [Timema douglasi]
MHADVYVFQAIDINLASAKHKYVERWLHANDFSDSTSDIEPNDRKPPPSTSKSESQNYTSLDSQDEKDDSDLASTKQILNELYGREWHGLDVFSNKCKTDKIKRTRSRLLVLKDVKHKNIPKHFTPALATPDFINDNSLDTSLTLYLNNQSKAVKAETERTLRYREPCGGVNKRLHFSTDDESSDFSPFKKVKVKTTSRTQRKPTLPKRSEVTPNPKPVKPKKYALPEVAVGTITAESTKVKKTNVPTPPAKCDPLAKHYKKNFAKVKEELCSKLFKLYNEQVFDNQLPHDMSVTWNVRMKRTAGYCYNRRIVNSSGVKLRSSRIVLSTKVIGTPDRLRDTLIHEMCHAAAWVVDDVRDGHGPFWKKWAKRAIAQFPELPAIRRCHDYNIYTKFTYRCVNCAYSLGRHSKSLNLNTKRCGHCYGKFELLVNTKSKSGVVTQAVSTRRSPRGFARFVKENYGSVKKSQQGLKHGDVMKLLGQQFSALKMTQTP